MSKDEPAGTAKDTQEEGLESKDSDAPGPAGSHPAGAVDTLRRAMRRARHDNAERAGAVSDLRLASIGRLELLHEALKPLIAQIPPDVDTFDVGLMPGGTPRLFIDMIGFVEMARGGRTYRLLQDTRHGRVSLYESEALGTMVEAVTDYVARRLLERDKALAAEGRDPFPSPDGGKNPVATVASGAPDRGSAPSALATRPARSGPFRWIGIGFAFAIDLLGSIAFFTILAALGWYMWNRLHTPIE